MMGLIKGGDTYTRLDLEYNNYGDISEGRAIIIDSYLSKENSKILLQISKTQEGLISSRETEICFLTKEEVKKLIAELNKRIVD